MQITAEGKERDSSRILALSSFMENIFDVGQPLESLTLGEAFNFDDTEVVITGLLNVARRVSIQLLTEEAQKEDVDRVTLAEALRKALMVAKLCLKECANRDNINQVPHTVSLILSILENVANFDDKVLALQILDYVLQYNESKLELCRLGGLKQLCSLGSIALGHSILFRQQIVLTLTLCLATNCGDSQQSDYYLSRNNSACSDNTSFHGGEYCHAKNGVGDLSQMSGFHTLASKSSESGHGCSFRDEENAAQHQQNASGTQNSSWPPLPKRQTSHRGESAVITNCTHIKHEIGLPSGNVAHHPSASLVAKGVNMAVNAVTDVLKLTPMATGSWLQSDLKETPEGDGQRKLLHCNSGITEDAAAEEVVETPSGVLDIVAPSSWREYECLRLENCSDEVSMYDTNFSSTYLSIIGGEGETMQVYY